MASQPTPREEPGLLDALMLLLALLSVGLLLAEWFGWVSADWLPLLLRVDLALCAVFAIEFVWRWRAAGFAGRFVLRNWYEVVGMIPVAHPALRGFRLLRVLRIVAVLARSGRLADWLLGRGTTQALLDRAQDALVERAGGAITLFVLEEVGEVLASGRYAHTIAASLGAREDELRKLLHEKLREDAELKKFSALPFFDALSRALVDAILRITLETLRDARTEALIAELLKDNLSQLRASVKARVEPST